MRDMSSDIAVLPTGPGRAPHAPSRQGINAFIRVAEVWIPTRDRLQLQLGDGLYGSFGELRAISEQTRFGRGDGLPGKAWAAGHPIVVPVIGESWHPARAAAGLGGAIALPVFVGEYLMAVAVLVCARDDAAVGAIELWHNDPDKSFEMRLVDGYYGNAETFAFNARHTKFPRGYGLPGRAWKSRMPLVANDLLNSQSFLRGAQAAQIGINRGLAIPYANASGRSWAATFLSARDTAMARRFEIWIPDEGRDALVFHAGDCDHAAELATAHAQARIARGEGFIGQAWLSGIPALCDDVARERCAAGRSAGAAGLEAALALPFIQAGQLKAVIAWYF